MVMEEPFRGYAQVLALPKKLDEAIAAARRAARTRSTTVYVGWRKGTYVVWTPISNEEVVQLTYDPKLKTMPWLDLREMHDHAYDYAFDPPGRGASHSHVGGRHPHADMKRLSTPLKDRSRYVLQAIADGTYRHSPRDNYLLNRLHNMGWWSWEPGRSGTVTGAMVRKITPAGRLVLAT